MHRTATILMATGLLAGAAAVAWHPVAVPRLVKFPTDVDRTDHYAGTMVTYVDKATGATLATPTSVPLTVDRRLQSVPGESGSKVALVKETLTANVGESAIVQENVYALDRRSMENVADPRAYTFVPGNVPDRSGTYYLTLPMGVHSSGEEMQIWKPEAAASYPLVSTSPAKGNEGGASVVYLRGEIPTPLPAPPAEQAALQAQGLPKELTPEQASARLSAAGIDVAAVAPVLVSTLTPEELKAVTDSLGKPLPLNYFIYGHGTLAVEPRTGGLVKLDGVVDGVSVQPDMSGMGSALAALKQHADVPAIAGVVGILEKMAAAPPQPVFELQYTQTPESVKDAADYAKSEASKMQTATTTIPIVLGVLAALLLLSGVVIIILSRRHHPSPGAVVEMGGPAVKSAA